MQALIELLVFAVKTALITGAVATVVLIIVNSLRRTVGGVDGRLSVDHLNRQYQQRHLDLKLSLLPRAEAKKLAKKHHKQLKKQAKSDRERLFVLDFAGDLAASAVHDLRETLNSLIPELHEGDEVLLRLESPGGKAHAYGFAASQLQRFRDRKIPLTVCIDKMAASGGYMMACVADRIIASPFAMVGSIGVVAMIPNFHRFLKKHGLDYEELTAGQYKRTVSMFAENTQEGREKFISELEEFHTVFREFVKAHRPQVDIEQIATGEVFYGQKALDLALVDELRVSDDVLIELCADKEVYAVTHHGRPDMRTRLSDWLTRRFL